VFISQQQQQQQLVYGAIHRLLLLQTTACGVLRQIYVSTVTFKLYNNGKT
jgi:hypothetical protein